MENRKVLFVATIAKHILQFHLPYLKWFKDMGFETHVACKGEEVIPYCDYIHIVDFERSPFNFKNIFAFWKLNELISNTSFKLIHAHTPVAGVLTRLSARNARKKGTKVLYTVHGFHFFSGGPWGNRFLYYQIEKYFSRFTDGIITINSEDYNLVISHNFRCGKCFQIPGIGVHTNKFLPLNELKRFKKRKEMGLTPGDFIMVNVGEFIPRKNHRFLINCMKDLTKTHPDFKLLFCGRGRLESGLKKYTLKSGIKNNVKFLGFRTDVAEIVGMSDVGVSSSRHEGLGLNIAEEMSAGLPVLATEDKGHREMIIHGENGFMYEQNNYAEFIKYILILYNNPSLRKRLGENGRNISKKFDIENSMAAMGKIYNEYI